MITPYPPFPAGPQWMPSIIIGWQKNKKIACPPHGTEFTGTGFGSCYGALIDGQLMSFDMITGKPAPVADILPNHDEFAIFSDQDHGTSLVSLERYIALINESNEATLAAQALMANAKTVELADENEAGAPQAIRDKISFIGEPEKGPVLRHKNLDPITEAKPRRVLSTVDLSELVQGTDCILDAKRQILWIPPESAPLIDCPVLEFDHLLRCQLEEAFPSKKAEWAIVAKGAGDDVVEKSRRWSTWHDECQFVMRPHAADFHDATRPVIAYDGRLDVTIEHDMIIAETDDWHYQGRIVDSYDGPSIGFDPRDWSHMIIRPGVRYGIVAKVRAMLQTTKTTCLIGMELDR